MTSGSAHGRFQKVEIIAYGTVDCGIGFVCKVEGIIQFGESIVQARVNLK